MFKKDYDEICEILRRKNRKDLICKLLGTVGYNNALLIKTIRDRIADKDYALQFQNVNQYQKALLQDIDILLGA